MISFSFSQTQNGETPVFVPLFLEDLDPKRRKVFRSLTRAQKRALRSVLLRGFFPKAGVHPIFSGDAPVYLFLLGNRKESERREIFEAGQTVFSSATGFELEKIIVVPGSLNEKEFSAFQEGVLLGSYEFLDFKGKKKGGEEKKEEKKLTKVVFSARENKKISQYVRVVAEGVRLTKNIINTPPSVANPDFMEEEVQKIAKGIQNVRVSVLSRKKLEELGCGGIVNVGRGSRFAPRLLVLEYSGGAKKEQPIALVGKGVTFDTGGNNIKGRYMRWMKQDLGGAATVLGAFFAIASLELKKNVLAVLPVVENTVSRDAYLPDDVLHMYNGMTVEVDNTDAEGRLILADALAYAEEKYKPRAIVDLATLTGACVYAVGTDFTAALTNDKKLFDALKKSAENTDEPMWELPLHQRYKKALKSEIADIVNCSDGLKPGTIEGGLFLQHFVSEKTPWCHLDIASVAFDEKKGLATGRNVRLLVDFVKQF
ncbi:leucyl aminopeptidase family protein [Candidatus Peregrinibacteria bacterium]|nr:MAG: leucyl aminopeptidase family protein [Candidatus Peregrinibacteria bacterium]